MQRLAQNGTGTDQSTPNNDNTRFKNTKKTKKIKYVLYDKIPTKTVLKADKSLKKTM